MPPPRAPWRDLAALAFALVFPALLTWLYLVVLGSPAGMPAEASGPVRFAFAAGKLVQFIFPVVYVAVFERERLRPARPGARGLAPGLAFALVVDAAMLGLFLGCARHHAWFAETPAKVYRLLLDMGAATPGAFLALGAAYAVGHSLLEEYYWRWFVFGSLRRYLPSGAAITLSAVGFTAHHVVLLAVYFPGRFWLLAVPLSAGVAIGGAVWAWLYDRTGALYAPWVSHGLIDAGIFTVGYVMLLPYWTG